MFEGNNAGGGERERESSRDYIHHTARVLKGPGIAVRAPPGTNYRVYGLVVISSESHANSANSKESHTVYVSLPDAEETTITGNTLSPSKATNTNTTTTATKTDLLISSSSVSTIDDIRSVREYDRMVNSVLTLPLGDSLEERNSVRGYAWSGTVPFHLRPFLWRLLCGHIPCAPASLSRQQAELRRKREEYDNFVAKYYKISIIDFIQTSSIQGGGGGSGGGGGGNPSRFQEREQEEMLISKPSSHMNMNMNNNTSSRSGSTSATGGGTTEEESSKIARRKKMMMMITPDEQAILSQIALDLPRHSHALFHHPETASALARCLFLWSRRFPAVGYVQGIDDIMVVFFFVFLSGAINERNIQIRRNERDHNKNSSAADGNTSKEHDNSSSGSGNSNSNNNNTTTINKGKENQWIPASVVFTRDVNELDVALQNLPEDLFRAAEADTYFCGGFFLSWLQDNFVQGQSGIIRSMSVVEKVLEKSDPDILSSITSQGITLVDCCFQWVHCLLARELPLEMIVLLWEKYLAMGNSETVIDFHAYVCAAFLMQLRDKLLGKSVDVVIQLLKDPLGVRVKQKEQQQQQLAGGNDTVYDRRWLEELISTASQLYHKYPIASLT